ncbi:MAG: hypothetical protein OJF50_000661 [Nitrospira sp.]|jgi:hypothetical protein|nr:hypothetical protein [Nitrospira sp.]
MAIDLQLSHYNELSAFPGKPTRTTDLAYTNTQRLPDKSEADAPTREQFQ